MTRSLNAALLGVALAMPAGYALAHHGWAWTTGGNLELTGVIAQARLGNPHGQLEVDVEGETWTVEVGQPWRNERAADDYGDADDSGADDQPVAGVADLHGAARPQSRTLGPRHQGDPSHLTSQASDFVDLRQRRMIDGVQ